LCVFALQIGSAGLVRGDQFEGGAEGLDAAFDLVEELASGHDPDAVAGVVGGQARPGCIAILVPYCLVDLGPTSQKSQSLGVSATSGWLVMAEA
jgi:hypothetical protein